MKTVIFAFSVLALFAGAAADEIVVGYREFVTNGPFCGS